MADKLHDLDAGVFKPTLEELLRKSANCFQYQWPTKYSSVKNGQIIFVTRMEVTINTYNGILHFVGQIPPDPLRKPLVFAVAPLVRTLFEELVALILIFHDLPSLILSYNMTSYTDLWRERRAVEQYYASQPSWQNYLNGLNSKLSKMEKDLKLTPTQVSNPTSKKYGIGMWPTPGQAVNVLNAKYKGSSAIKFVEFINAWMYRSLSGESHLNLPALQRRGINFTPKAAKEMYGEEKYKERLNENWIDYHKEMTWATYTLLLSIISEIEGHFGYQMKEKAKYLWEIFRNHSDMAAEFYEWRYKDLLQ